MESIVKFTQDHYEEFGYKTIESLTTLVGPRPAGSKGDELAVNWAMKYMESLGFKNIHKQPVPYPKWTRGKNSLRIISPVTHDLVSVALGGTGKTSEKGVKAPVIRFSNLKELETATKEEVKGKIVYVNFAMSHKVPGHHYGAASMIRKKGPKMAYEKGALGFIMRSAGTSSHRFAHTGSTDRVDENFVALSISIPDAEHLDRLYDHYGKTPIILELHSQNQWSKNDVNSYNVMGEIPGDGSTSEMILLGAHLDSWDLGTGALDDAAGVGIVIGCAKILSNFKLKRGIRIVLFANEENGLIGAHQYVKDNNLSNIYLGMESDSGVNKIIQMSFKGMDKQQNLVLKIQEVLNQYTVVKYDNKTFSPPPDLTPFVPKGVPILALHQDASKYFNYHHTLDDTLDKIEKKDLLQNILVYAISTYLASWHE